METIKGKLKNNVKYGDNYVIICGEIYDKISNYFEFDYLIELEKTTIFYSKEEENNKSEQKELPKEEIKEVSKEVEKEETKEVSKEIAKEETKEIAKEVTEELAKEDIKEVTKEDSKEKTEEGKTEQKIDQNFGEKIVKALELDNDGKNNTTKKIENSIGPKYSEEDIIRITKIAEVPALENSQEKTKVEDKESKNEQNNLKEI